MSRFSLLCLALAVAAPALPVAAEQFRYKFRVGQRRESRISLAAGSLLGTPGGDQTRAQFRMVMKQVTRVRSVAGGVATLESVETPVSSKIMVGDQTSTLPGETTRSTMKVTERGKQVSRGGAGGGAGLGGSPLDALESLYGVVFPARDLKVGDGWTETLTVDSAGAPQKVTLNCKYEARETVFGRNCARIVTQFTVAMPKGGEEGLPAPSGKVTGRLVTYFDPAAGEDLYTSGTLNIVARTDLSGLDPEAGEFATVMKINYIQSRTGLKASGQKK
jgi:hypothetical protein